MLRTLSAFFLAACGLFAQAPKPVTQQPPVQPSIVHLEFPPSVTVDILPRLSESILPSLVSAFAVLLGIFLTNRQNQKANERNRILEDERWFRQHRYEMKRGLLTDVAKQIAVAHTAGREWARARKKLFPIWLPLVSDDQNRYCASQKQLYLQETINLSKLALASSLFFSKTACDKIEKCVEMVNAVSEELEGDNKLQEAAKQKHLDLIEEFVKSAKDEIARV
jgi:hypothetical protein